MKSLSVLKSLASTACLLIAAAATQPTPAGAQQWTPGAVPRAPFTTTLSNNTLLVFGMTVFFVTSMASVIAQIPKEEFDYARTLRMSEWRVVWEVVVLGTAAQAWEVLRQNAAIGWMMLTMVEGISRSEGGVGAMLLNQSKHFHLAEVFAIQILILVVGMIQDYGIGLLRRITCPYADLTLERKEA